MNTIYNRLIFSNKINSISGIIILLIVIFSQQSCNLSEQANTRKVINFNKSWQFVNESPPKIIPAIFNPDDKTLKWEMVNLPHTASIEPLVISGKQWQGNCLYRKFFSVSKSDIERQIWIKFEGAMHTAEIYLNGEFLQKHMGGYLPILVDLTGKVKAETNCIIVVLNNEDNPLVPPGKPIADLDFNYFGGLYRNVNLIIKNPIYITDECEPSSPSKGGISVWYEGVSEQNAIVNIESEIKNSYNEKVKVNVDYQLCDNKGIVIGKANIKSTIGAGEKAIFPAKISVLSPLLWSPDEPNLYWLKTQIVFNDKIVDSDSLKIGIRNVEILRKEGLLLNGKKIKIRGTNRHQEYPYIGYALSDNANYRDAFKIKSAGFNFVRLSHYPQSPSFISACDELGILVMDAIPGWQFFGNDTFQNNSIQDVRNMVRRDRNHPSVIIWEASLNESGMNKDFMQRAHFAVHEELPVQGVYTAGWLNEVYDIFIPSRQASQPPHYWNNYADERPMLISEYGDWEYYAQNAGLNQTEFSDLKSEDRSSRQSRGYGQKRLAQQALNYQEAHNNNLKGNGLGDANWLMFDYNRGYAPDIEESGIMDIFRLPKFAYYFYQSQVKPDLQDNSGFKKPMIFIANYWNDPQFKRVKVYSNCEQVALYLNGKLIAKKSPDSDVNSSHLNSPPFTFDLPLYMEGTLEANGYLAGNIVVSVKQHTPGQATSIILTTDISNKLFTAGVNDVIFVYAHIQDTNGNITPENGKMVLFSLTGNAELIGDNPAKVEAGIATILLKAGENAGEITISAKSEGLKTSNLFVKSVN